MSVAVQVVTVVGLLLLASVGVAQSPTVQEKAPPAPGAEQKAQASQTPVAVPIPAIAAQAEAVTKLLRDLEALARPGPEIEAIQARLLEVSARLGPELASTIETLKHAPPLPILDRLRQSWQASRLELAEWQEVLTKRTAQIERELDRLAGLRARWTQTRTDAQASQAPAAVVQRVDAVLADMAGVWAAVTLRNLLLLEPVVALGQAVLAAELRGGTISIALGDVLAFVITVWLAFLVSALLRFVLEEDVYPRLPLARGLPYVLSRLLHYLILLLGFLLAVGALGLDLTRVTVLAGAFGVGLGFGLQSVVNNFVSGLIVLVERPIHLGDAIRMSDVEGEVWQIGIRSTTVRTPEGADIIIPNASLIAEKVTNWTHSDRLRRLSVQVGVAYGSAPEKVLALLRGVAASHPGVLTQPAPLALFLGFGDSALNFELRAWTDRFDQWVVIRSELNVAVYAALQKAEIEIPFPQREVRLREG